MFSTIVESNAAFFRTHNGVDYNINILNVRQDGNNTTYEATIRQTDGRLIGNSGVSITTSGMDSRLRNTLIRGDLSQNTLARLAQAGIDVSNDNGKNFFEITLVSTNYIQSSTYDYDLYLAAGGDPNPENQTNPENCNHSSNCKVVKCNSQTGTLVMLWLWSEYVDKCFNNGVYQSSLPSCVALQDACLGTQYKPVPIEIIKATLEPTEPITKTGEVPGGSVPDGVLDKIEEQANSAIDAGTEEQGLTDEIIVDLIECAGQYQPGCENSWDTPDDPDSKGNELIPDEEKTPHGQPNVPGVEPLPPKPSVTQQTETKTDEQGNTTTTTTTTTSSSPEGFEGSGSGSGSGNGSGSGSVSVDFPVFCGWASVVCDFLDWFTSEELPEEPNLPHDMIEDNVISPTGITVGYAGTCPQNQQITLSLGLLTKTYEIPYTPLCDLAAKLRPFIILLSLVVSARILLNSF